MINILLIFLFILQIFLIIIALIVISFFYYFLKGNAPFLPTSRKNLKQFQEIFDFLEKLNLKNESVIDLGSGSGEVVLEFARKGYKSYGVELNPFLVFLSKIRAIKNNNAYFIKGDLYKINLNNFKIIYIYQLEEVNKKLIPKFENELQKGAIIISNKFPLEESQKIKLIHEFDKKNFLIYKIIS
jgi:SAM-dependent methyltransferase